MTTGSVKIQCSWQDAQAAWPFSALLLAPIDALDHVVITTEDSDRAAALYGARLGLDLALDRSHHDWGQLMFFRCGDLIVEVVRRPVAGGDQAGSTSPKSATAASRARGS